jgi:UDP-N-acetylmuramoylalanine--D-glutamate ligase
VLSKEFFQSVWNRKVTILGAERSGIGAAKLVKKLGGIPFVSDFAKPEKLQDKIALLKSEQIDFETGGHTERLFDTEFVIISPGVPSSAPVVKDLEARNIPIISELEFAALFCKGTIIAITGTNGKSTTTTLIDHLLKTAGYYSVMAGNIGLAFSEVVLDVPADGFVSLEVSSFQLDHVLFFKPRAAMILNITIDHMNRYEHSMTLYAESKYKIFKNLDASDYLILNGDSEWFTTDKIQTRAAVEYFSLHGPINNGICLNNDEIIEYVNGEITFACPVSSLQIPGEHNVQNAMAAVASVKPFIKDNEVIVKGLQSFKGIEHRLELVEVIDGTLYVNDSKATNVDSVWYALKSYDTPIYLILGGRDKGNDYEQIKPLVLEKVKKIYAIGESAEKVFKFFHKEVKVEIKKSMDECIHAASKEARENEVVLLSPACASFDMYDNFEHRGQVFKEAVRKLLQ